MNKVLSEIFWKALFWGIFALIFWGISYLVYQHQPEYLWRPLVPFYYAYAWGKGVGIIIFVVILAVIMGIKDFLRK